MNTKPKRKYGEIRKGAETSAGTNEEVFDKFFSPHVAPSPRDAPSVDDAPSPKESQPRQINAPSPSVTPSLHDAPSPGTGARWEINVSKWHAMPNDIEDKVMPTLDVYAQAVFRRLYRLTRGHHTDTTKVSRGKLATTCAMGDTKAKESLTLLELRGLIKIISADFSNPDQRQRGLIIKMLLPGASLRRDGASSADGASRNNTASSHDPIKEKALNRQFIKEPPLPQADPQKHTAAFALMDAGKAKSIEEALAMVEREGK